MRPRGQAMAEFAVTLGVLALLLTGLPVLQRYHQLQFAAVGAARESAWLASWRTASATAGAAPAGESAGTAALDLAQLRARWLPEGAGAAGAPSVDRDQAHAVGVSLSVSRAALPGMAGQGAKALLLPLRPLQAIGAGGGPGDGPGDGPGAGLQADGFIRASATLDVATPGALPEPFGGLGLQLAEQYALAADGWGASGPAQVVSRVDALVPSSLLARVPGLVTVGTALLSLIEPQFRHFCPGYVNPEIVPADRLARDAGNVPVTSWRPSC